MATIDSSLVRGDIEKLLRTSLGVKKLVHKVFEQMEAAPSVFDELEFVSPAIAESFHNVTLRKAKITHHRHDFRIVFAHWTLKGGTEHCDVLLVSPRRRGYEIDWDWIESSLREP